jgi:uncharacterized protein YjiS (DUF1127 family)
MSPSRHRGSALVATARWPTAIEASARASSPFAVILGCLRRWRERDRQRRELSLLNARDFADLAVPPSLVADELRRWPWQGPSPQWRTVGN